MSLVLDEAFGGNVNRNVVKVGHTGKNRFTFGSQQFGEWMSPLWKKSHLKRGWLGRAGWRGRGCLQQCAVNLGHTFREVNRKERAVGKVTWRA